MPSQEEKESREKKLVIDYLKQHELEKILNDSINQLVKDRPEDPFLVMSTLLKQHSKASKGILFIKAKQVYDSQGIPTLNVSITTDRGVFEGSVPSSVRSIYDKPTNSEEENPYLPYDGKGMQQVADQLTEILQVKLEGLDPTEQEKIDQLLWGLETRIGRNAVFATSIAICKAGAKHKNIAVNEYIASLADVPNENSIIPLPIISIFNGGNYGSNKLFVRDIMILPYGVASFSDALRVSNEIYLIVKKKLILKGNGHINEGVYGGFGCQIQNIEEAFDILQDAIKQVQEMDESISEIGIAIDVCASDFYVPSEKEDGPSLYNTEKWFEISKGRNKTSDDLLTIYKDWIKKYNIKVIIDPFHENDVHSYALLNNAVKDLGNDSTLNGLGGDVSCQIEIVACNLINIGFENILQESACNTILLNFFQSGTVSRAIFIAKESKKNGFPIIVSSEPGHSGDVFLSDFTIGIAAGQIKTGGLLSYQHINQYNYMLTLSQSPFCPAYAGQGFRQI